MPVRDVTPADRDGLRRVAAAALHLEPVGRSALVDLLLDRPAPDPGALVAVAAQDGPDVTGFAFGSLREGVGCVDAFAVAPHARRRGTGSALLAAAEERLLAAGATSLTIGGSFWEYAWPGVDTRYALALRVAAAAGYSRRGTAENMDVDLSGWVPRDVPVSEGITVRRAGPADADDLAAMIAAEGFSPVWDREFRAVIDRVPVPAFIARRDGDVLGFACHGVHRVDWFGPIGVREAARGTGVGEALLRLCLDDQAAAGIATVQISWIGPEYFYRRTVGACVNRRFHLLGKDVPAAP